MDFYHVFPTKSVVLITNKYVIGAGDMAQLVECLLSMH